MTIAILDRKNCKLVSDLLEKHLESFAKEHGLTIQAAGGTMVSDGEFKAKLVIKVNDPEAKARIEKEEFTKYCRLYDLTAADYNRVITINREEWHVVGFALNRDKYPVRCRRVSDGKESLWVEKVIASIQTKAPKGDFSLVREEAPSNRH